MKTTHCSIAAIAFAAGCLVPSGAFAATLLVKPDGTTPYYSTIQSAIAAAQDGDTIECEEGVYDTGTAYSTDTGWAYRRAYCASKSNLTIKGAGRGRTIVKGSGAATGTGVIGGFHFKNCDNIKISDITFAYCGTTGTDVDRVRSQGAAVLAEGGSVVLEDCSFEHCRAIQGGAVAGFCAAANLVNGGTETLTAVRCLFSDCSSSQGGAVAWNAKLFYCVSTRLYNDSVAPIKGCTLINCTFANNSNHHYLEKSVVYNTVFSSNTFRLGNGTTDETIYNCVATAQKTNVTVVEGDSANLYGQNDIYFYNFIADDYRPVAGSVLVAAGNADYILLMPEAYRTKDICGNTVDLSGAVNVGAAASAASVVAPTSKHIRIIPSDGDSLIVVNGVTNRFDGGNNGSFHMNRVRLYFFNEYPFMNRVRIISSQVNWGMTASGADTTTRFPEDDGDYMFMSPPASLSSGLTLTHQTAAVELLVDSESSAATPDGTVGNEFPTVQAAVDAAPSSGYSIIRVAAGTYAGGGAKLTSGDVKSRVAVSGKKLRIIGAGADSTFLVGEPDGNAQEGEYGCGNNAVRCFATDTSGQLSGFTLTGGHTAFGSANNPENTAGALLAKAAFTVTDCIISNNVSSRTTMIGKDVDNRLVLSRCRIEGNTSIYTPMWATDIVSASCLWANNIVTTLSTTSRDIPLWGGNYGQDQHGWLFDSTFYIPGCKDSSGTVNFQGYAGGTDRTTSLCRNCLILGSGATKYITCYGTVVDTFIPGSTKTTSTSGLTGGVSGYKILGFNDAANGDFRLRGTSEGATNAVWLASDVDSHAYIYTTASLDGVWPDLSGETQQPSGCYRRPVARVTAGSYLTPSVNWIAPGESVEFAIDTKVPVQYVTVNGVRQEQPDGPYAFTYTYPQDAASRAFAVEVVKDTDWYVDAVNGSDAGHGTLAAPLAKLSDACERAVSGDTVHVAPGAYTEGVMEAEKKFWTQSPGNVKSRVTVRSGITVEASDPSAETAIVGASAPAGDDDGLGVGAVRCAVVHSGGRLRGFTLRDGRTTANSYNDDGLGAAVLGDTDGYVEDCVITNCRAYLSAGNGYCSFNRCKFVGCRSIGNWAVGLGGRYVNCYFNHNFGGNTLTDAYVLDSCTIGADHVNAWGDGINVIYSFKGTEVRNLLFLSKNGKITLSSPDTVFKGCFLLQSKVSGTSGSTWSFDAACRDLSIDDLPVDGDGHPLFGTNPAIDGGETSAYDVATMGDRDCDGNSRIMNGNKIDVGCFEYDWRGKFAEKLGHRVTVSAASSGVELLAQGVKVPANEMLSLAVATRPDKSFFFNALVNGGMLAVTKDGEDFAVLTASGRRTYRGGVQPTADFVFSQDDVGYSVLSDFRLNVGGSLSFR